MIQILIVTILELLLTISTLLELMLTIISTILKLCLGAVVVLILFLLCLIFVLFLRYGQSLESLRDIINNHALKTSPINKPKIQVELANNENEECRVCRVYKISHALIPCGHFYACHMCIIEAYQTGLCGICRGATSGTLRIYDA